MSINQSEVQYTAMTSESSFTRISSGRRRTKGIKRTESPKIYPSHQFKEFNLNSLQMHKLKKVECSEVKMINAETKMP